MHDDDDNDTLQRLAAARPVDLPELGVRLADELPALVLRLPPRLLLDRLLRRPDLRCASAARGRRSVTGGSPRRTPLPAGLARQLPGLPMRRVPTAPAAVFLNSTRSGEFRFDFWVW